MAKPVHEITIMSQKEATSIVGGMSTGNHKRKRKAIYKFMYEGHKICRVTFLKLQALAKAGLRIS
uniref:Uncharacterized protein n=1 Tax=Amphimedon queenslandica TaxID=400682 RepID=A0A1X7U773_AMPQE